MDCVFIWHKFPQVRKLGHKDSPDRNFLLFFSFWLGQESLSCRRGWQLFASFSGINCCRRTAAISLRLIFRRPHIFFEKEIIPCKLVEINLSLGHQQPSFIVGSDPLALATSLSRHPNFVNLCIRCCVNGLLRFARRFDEFQGCSWLRPADDCCLFFSHFQRVRIGSRLRVPVKKYFF